MSRRVGGYELIEELGRGAMGVVWRARDPAGRHVALKLLTRARDPKAVERLRREGQIAAGLTHSGIVRVLSAGEDGEQPWLACELVEGARPLDEAWVGLPLPARVALVTQAAEALAHAHARGVVHRDVKPQNLLVGSDGRVRVADFGLARALETERLTRTGAMLGTPSHMAPEQLAADPGRPPGPPADVWSLGVVLYQALTGRLPIEAATLPELVAALLAPRIIPPRRLASDVPAALEAVCLRCLAARPEARFRDAGELAAALSGRAVTPRSASWSGLGADAGRGLPAALLGALLLLVLVGLAGAAWWSAGGGGAGSAALSSEALVLVSPPDGAATIDAQVLVRGRVQAPFEALRVRVGARLPQRLASADGSFEATHELGPGENQVRVQLLDPEGRVVLQRELRLVRHPAEPWARELPPERRPPIPLPAGLSFGKRAREYLNASDGSLLVWVPPGTFSMGSDRTRPLGSLREAPQHRVTVSRGFFLGKHEVTWSQYERFCQETGRTPPRRTLVVGDTHPVHVATPAMAVTYCRWAGLRLPSEVEWEYAARGQEDARLYPWGDEPDPTRAVVARSRAALGTTPDPVGSLPRGASPFGALDMAGNVLEPAWRRLDPYEPGACTDPRCSDRPEDLILRSTGCNASIEEAVVTRRMTAEEALVTLGGSPSFLGIRVAR